MTLTGSSTGHSGKSSTASRSTSGGKVYPWTGSCDYRCTTCACAEGVCAQTLSQEARAEVRARRLKDLSARLLCALEECARKVPVARRWVAAAYAAVRENPEGFIRDPRNSLEFWDAVIEARAIRRFHTMQG